MKWLTGILFILVCLFTFHYSITSVSASPIIFGQEHHTDISEPHTYDKIENLGWGRSGRNGRMNWVFSKSEVGPECESVPLNVSNAARASANLTKSQLKSIASLEKQIASHTQKLKAYKANPYKFDNKGLLKNAPNDAVHKKIIQSRIKHLEQEINTFQNNIQKILNGQ